MKDHQWLVFFKPHAENVREIATRFRITKDGKFQRKIVAPPEYASNRYSPMPGMKGQRFIDRKDAVKKFERMLDNDQLSDRASIIEWERV